MVIAIRNQLLKLVSDLLNILEADSCYEDHQNHRQTNGDHSHTNGDARTSADSPESSGPRQRRPQEKQPEPEAGAYTPDQAEAVKRVRKCQDYYEILGRSSAFGVCHSTDFLHLC